MGFRTGALICSVSFLFGALFVSLIVDSRVLYSQLTPEALDIAEAFYRNLYNAPMAIKALLHGMMALGVLALITKLHAWTESAKYFDGGSVALFTVAVAMYGSVVVPNIRLIAAPSLNTFAKSSLPQSNSEANQMPVSMSDDAEVLSLSQRAEAIQVLAAGNSLAIAALFGVVILQLGQWYVERTVGKEEKPVPTRRPQPVEEEKKND